MTLGAMERTPKEHREAVGRHIMMVREALGMGPTAFCRPIGIKPPALWNIETGAAYPSLYTLARICEEYGYSADYFLFGRRGTLPRDLADKIYEAEERARKVTT